MTTGCSNPPPLITGSYFGAAGDDVCGDIASDNEGFLYLACHSNSSRFPAPPGILPGLAGDMDAFVLKLHPVTMEPLWTARLGGSGWEGAFAVRVLDTGDVYVAGFTRSADFPVTPNAPQKELRGGSDGFVAILSREGTVEYATFLGGSGDEQCQSLAVDSLGTIYVALTTNSADFPGAAGPSYAGDGDAVVARWNPRMMAPVRSRYLGGTGAEKAAGLAFRHSYAGVFVSGSTASPDFPARPHYVRSKLAGKSDGFVSFLAPDTLDLKWSTYLGGSGEDRLWSLAADREGHLSVAGSTTSDDLPSVERSEQKKRAGGSDAFYSYLNGATGEITWSYLFGGDNDDSAGSDGTSLCIDANGNAWLAGMTSSANLRTTRDAPLRRSAGAADGFVVVFDPRSPTIRFATFWGGSGRDLAHGVTCNAATGKTYLTGATWSNDLPSMTGHRTYAGNADFFVTAFSVR